MLWTIEVRELDREGTGLDWWPILTPTQSLGHILRVIAELRRGDPSRHFRISSLRNNQCRI